MILALITVLFVVLGALAFRPSRWAYSAFVALGILFFPARVGFHFHPQPCECALDAPLALFSLTNYGHIWRFAFFFLMTSAQVRSRHLRSQLLIALGTVLAMGIYVELAEGLTGEGHCRLRDLVPDLAGAVLGAVLLMLWNLYQRRRARLATRPAAN
jgi:hypothetical protein